MPFLVQVCAVCQKNGVRTVLGTVEVDRGTLAGDSHGYCPLHFEEAQKEMRRYFKEVKGGFPKSLPCLSCGRPRRATWSGDRVCTKCQRAWSQVSDIELKSATPYQHSVGRPGS